MLQRQGGVGARRRARGGAILEVYRYVDSERERERERERCGSFPPKNHQAQGKGKSQWFRDVFSC